MTKLGSLKYLMLVFGVLLCGVVGLAIYDRLQPATNTTIAVARTDLFANFNLDAVTKITLKNADATVELVSKDGNWLAGNKKADQAEVKKLVDELKNTKLYDLVSKNPENHTDLGTDATTGYAVTVEQGENKIEFLVGNSSGTGSAFFLRRSNENEVYLSRSSLKGLMNTDINKWLNKMVVTTDFEKLGKIDVTGSKTFYIYKNKDSKWIRVLWGAEKELTDENVTSIKTMFSPLEAFAFATDEEKSKYTATGDKMTIYLTDMENKEIAKWEIAKVDDNYFAKPATSEDIFKLYTSKLDPLFEIGK